MSDEEFSGAEDVSEETVEEPTPAPAPAKTAKKADGTLTRTATGKPKDVKGPLSLLCSTKVTGTMYDAERQVRIPASGQNPVQVGGVKAGSWLWCQLDSGLVVKVGK